MSMIISKPVYASTSGVFRQCLSSRTVNSLIVWSVHNPSRRLPSGFRWHCDPLHSHKRGSHEKAQNAQNQRKNHVCVAVTCSLILCFLCLFVANLLDSLTRSG